jgi:hypothetical protein
MFHIFKLFGSLLLKQSPWIDLMLISEHVEGMLETHIRLRILLLMLVCFLPARSNADWSWVVPSEYPAIDSSLFEKGVKEAEKFRRNLLLKNAAGLTQAEILSEAVVRFQKLVGDHLAKENNVKGFRLKRKRLFQAIEGENRGLEPEQAFLAFEGKWYGIWDKMEVDHQWYPQINQHPPVKVDGFNPFWVHAVQFAWIGDGFGWNVVASEKEDADEYYILGTVFHVRDKNPEQVYLHRPHVGISVSEDRLIWLTAGEVFLEERIPAKDDLPERYTITGFNYQMNGRAQLSVRGNSFQAVYSRNPDSRTPWRQFWINLTAP